MATIVCPPLYNHSRNYTLIGARSTPTKPFTASDSAENSKGTETVTTSGRKKSRMEVYIDLISDEHNPPQLSRPKKSLDKNQKTTLHQYFARTGPEPVQMKSALSDKSPNVARPRISEVYIDLTLSPPRKRKSVGEDSGSGSEVEKGKKKARTGVTGGKVDENGKAMEKAMTNDDDKAQEHVKRLRKIAEPIWTALPQFEDRAEVEARMQLREFVVRFRPILRLAKTHLDALDEFGTFSRETAKAVTTALLDLIAVDAGAKEKASVKLAMKEVTAASGEPLHIWTALQKLLKSAYDMEITVPTSAVDGRTRKKVHRPEQLVDVLLTLVVLVVQGESVKLELAEGEKEMKQKGKVFSKALKEEEERWQEERAKLVFERPGKLAKGASKQEVEREKAYKAKYAAANKAHKNTLASLNSEYLLSNSASTSRFQPLGRDVDGRTYYILSPYDDAKIPPLPVREGATKWSWFVAVWGRKPESPVTSPEGNGKLESSEGSSKERTLNGDDSDSTLSVSEDDLLDHWYAFTSPQEIRRLAKWTDYVASAAVAGDKPTPQPTDDDLAPATGKEIALLCEKLNGFADYLEWRCKDEDA
ncbi:hypothetical protein DACRYDRAFT_14461 [Dacryopinax primogenitus]|uniref:Uncharacterized protein n=1 Tax=Dacryopinax primogenitus (strain DJM 731) TaxID=1858805 RepID=M5GD92_DACPD|nr:uncharacterized protein DACRYDRAFT_14461 [Dacryopinax primogenitus]EJU04362.1 hypothetical protein DACRYDRAFT_14461 [Dacryopinax primogenitus]